LVERKAIEALLRQALSQAFSFAKATANCASGHFGGLKTTKASTWHMVCQPKLWWQEALLR